MKASYLVANRLPGFSAVHLSTREGDKEANRPFFREDKSINENNPLVRHRSFWPGRLESLSAAWCSMYNYRE